MSFPRWFLAAGCLLLVNLALVVTSLVWRHAAADEPDASQGRSPALEIAGADSTSKNPLDGLTIPNELPTIPSLADPESLKDDPVFQEFRRLFSEQTSPLSEETSGTGNAGLQDEAYFAALDLRLETVGQLCSAARGIALEAARQARAGNRKQAEQFVKMATQLRDMAAKLLVDAL